MALTKITSGVIASEFSGVTNLVAASTVDIDWNSGQVFKMVPTANTTFTFSDYKVGMVKILIITGAGSNYTLTFNPTGSDTTDAIKLGGDYDDTNGTKNFIQIVCTDDDGTPEFFYTISQQAT